MVEASTRRDFFISFNSADLSYAQELDSALRQANYTTYYHPRDLGPGGNIPIWMDDALMNSAQTLALYSPDYTKDKAIYSKAERYATWWQDPLNDKRKLIPILLRKTQFTPLMAMISYIDATGKTPREAGNHVIACLRAPHEAKQRDLWRARQPLPAIFSAAYRPNPNFTGRFESLELLVKSLSDGSVAAVTAVSGMGGVGKTTLAAEYCHRFGGQYGGVWWIRAEQETTILSDLAQLAQRLGLEFKSAIGETARDCLAYLANQTRPWLLVLDNAPNGDALRPYLPTGAARCIVTSRCTEFGDMAQLVELDKWPTEVTRDYLLSRANRDDIDGAARLAVTLDGLPLAAEQAAVFLKDRTGLSFDDYIAEIARLIQQPRPAGAKGEYPDTVYAAFVKSLEALREKPTGEAALDILRLCSFLSPDGVDLAMLTSPLGRERLPDPLSSLLADKFRREDALSALASLSLLRREKGNAGDFLVFHRLLLAVMRDWQSQTERTIWSKAALRCLANVFARGPTGGKYDPQTDTSVWPVCSRLVPHVAFFKSFAAYYIHDGEVLTTMFENAARFLVGVGDFEDALSLREAALDIMRGEPEGNPAALPIMLKNSSDLYIDLGRFDKAEAYVREALKLFEAMGLPEDDIDYLRTLQGLAEILAINRDFVESEKYFTKIERIVTNRCGGQSMERGLILNSFGELYNRWFRATNDISYFAKAMSCAKDALAIAREIYGERHPTTANRIYFYAHKDIIARNWKGLAAQFEKAVAIMLSLRLPNHPLMRGFGESLVFAWRQSGASAKITRFQAGDLSDLLPAIRQVEADQTAWVARDPENRRFVPESFFERQS